MDKRSCEGEDQCVALAKLRGYMDAQFAELRPQMKTALEGVGNFRTYQEESRQNWAELKAERILRKEAEDNLSKKRLSTSNKIAIVAIAITCLAPPSYIVIPKFMRGVMDLYRITQEYEKLHSGEIQQRLAMPNKGELTTAHNSQQDAINVPNYSRK